jgi:hypothetical protein
MTPFSFLKKLKSNGIDLWVVGDMLRYQGPADALTSDILATLKLLKPVLMQILQNDSCKHCQQYEDLTPHGSGCVHKTSGNYQYQWSLLESLKECPEGYWN